MRITIMLLTLLLSSGVAAMSTPGDELGMYLMYKHNVPAHEARMAAKKYDAFFEAKRRHFYQRYSGEAVVDFSSQNHLNHSTGVQGPGYSIDFEQWYQHQHRRGYRSGLPYFAH